MISPSGRTRTRSCGSTTPPRRRPTASTRSPRNAANRGWPATAAGSRPSGSSRRRCRCSTRIRRSTTAPSAGSRARTGSCGSSAGSEVRTVCVAGYKGIHQDGHWPSEDYLRALDERFAGFVEKLEGPLSPLGARAGSLTARGRGLDRSAGGDRGRHRQRRRARDGTRRAGDRARSDARRDGHLDMPRHERRGARRGARHVRRRRRRDRPRPVGLRGRPERGRRHLRVVRRRSRCRPPTTRRRASAGSSLHAYLSELAGSQRVGEHGLVVLDWHNGNRSILVDHELSGLVVGLTLATRPEHVYRALLEATAFGTRKIIEAFEGAGVPVRRADRGGRADQEPRAHADLRGRDAPHGST